MRSHRLTAAVVVAAIVLAGLTACQDPNEANAANTPALAAPPGQQLAAAGQATKQAHDVPRMGRAAVLRALAREPYRWRTSRMNYELRLPGTTIRTAGDVRYTADGGLEARTDTSVSSLGAYGNIEMIYIGDKYYFSVPLVTPDGKYAEIDPQSPSSPFGPVFARYTQQPDPLYTLRGLRGGIRGLEYVGPARLYGDPMAHYRLTLDLHATWRARDLEAMAAGVPVGTRVTYQLWLDRKHRPCRVTFRVGHASVRAEFDRWGEPVHVVRPPRGQVVSGIAAPADGTA
jgi:hypothetical protein